MKIIDVRWETPEEKQKRINYYSEKNAQKDEASLIYCTNNLNKIISDYEIFKTNYKESKLKEQEDYYNKSLESYNNKIENAKKTELIIQNIQAGELYLCKCGGKLRYIDNFNFVGCVNYKDKSKEHNTINFPNWSIINDYKPKKYEIEYSKKHLELFRNQFNIPDFVKLSILYNFLKSNNVEILGDLSLDFYNNSRNSNLNSNNEEKIILQILKNKFKKVYHQQGIKFKTNLDFGYKTKVPDFIAVNDDCIYLFEAKKSISNIDSSQLFLYNLLLQHILDNKKQHKNIKCYFIIFDPNFNQEHYKNCLTIEKLNNL